MDAPPSSGRGASRFRAGLSAEARFDGRTHACEAHDLSRTGVLLAGAMPWPAERTVEVTLRSPSGDLELRVRVRVTRVDGDDEETRVGVEFLTLDRDQSAVLEALVARAIEDRVPPPVAALPDDATPQQIRDLLMTVPQARRIAMATTASTPREREILLNDPAPPVLEALARNPRLLKHEARILLRRRDLLPSTMEVLGRDPRWLADAELRMFIVTHPRASFALVDRLVSGMSIEDKQRVLQRPGLNPGVRQKLMQEVARRKR